MSELVMICYVYEAKTRWRCTVLKRTMVLNFVQWNCRGPGVALGKTGIKGEKREFMKFAAIGYVNFDTYSFLCGGTLISEKFVLTAAHCCTGSDVPPHLCPEDADAGSSSEIGEPEGLPPSDSRSLRSTSKPLTTGSKKKKKKKKKSDVPFSSGIRPACLWHQDGVGEYTKAIVTGWGITNTLDLFDNDFCDSLLPGNRHFVGFTDSQICAGYLGGGQDTCQGDSGGPLQVTSSENKCIFYVMGVTSLGKSCGDKDTPAIYTRVSSYIEWIEPIVWPK
ncbi:hypothetical protein K1T71_015087 [Dendrolimus kikuchii]|nr:hypothetical protein K1T71_015087 [Dendrolimus kikuchii]